MEKRYYVPGYAGYIPGDKWRFGSRSSSEPPALWRNSNGAAVQQANGQTGQRPQSRRQRLQSAKGDRIRSANHFERIATRPMDTATQYPVHTTEMAVQADVVEQTTVENGEGNGKDPSRRSRPQSRAGQRQLDGRVVNNQRPDVLFMQQDPFRGLGGQLGNTGGGRMGRYYHANGQTGRTNGIAYGDAIPAPGYSGHIPGLKLFVGKPYGDALRTLRESRQKSNANTSR